MVALGDPRGDDADHARVPALAREHVGAGSPAGRGPVLGDLRLGGEEDLRLDVAALRVDRVELRGDRAGPRQVGGEQQLEAGVGAVQPARRR